MDAFICSILHTQRLTWAEYGRLIWILCEIPDDYIHSYIINNVRIDNHTASSACCLHRQQLNTYLYIYVWSYVQIYALNPVYILYFTVLYFPSGINKELSHFIVSSLRDTAEKYLLSQHMSRPLTILIFFCVVVFVLYVMTTPSCNTCAFSWILMNQKWDVSLMMQQMSASPPATSWELTWGIETAVLDHLYGHGTLLHRI